MIGGQTTGSSPARRSKKPTRCSPIQMLLSTRTTSLPHRRGFGPLHRCIGDERTPELLLLSRFLALPLPLRPFLAEELLRVPRPERILVLLESFDAALHLELAHHFTERAVNGGGVC